MSKKIKLSNKIVKGIETSFGVKNLYKNDKDLVKTLTKQGVPALARLAVMVHYNDYDL